MKAKINDYHLIHISKFEFQIPPKLVTNNKIIGMYIQINHAPTENQISQTQD